VVRGYVQHLQFNAPLPGDVEVDKSFRLAPNKIAKVRLISEWELETLCREAIIHAKEMDSCPETFRRWSYFARAINRIKCIEGLIAGKFINPNNTLVELHRIAHRQFPWQFMRPNQILMTRYFKIYRHPPLDQIVTKVFGTDIQALYLTGLAFLGVYLENIALFYPPNIEIEGVTLELLQKFIDHFSLPVGTLREKLQKEQEMNDKFFYAYHSLRAYPLIRMNYQEHDSLVCPLPTLLFWRLTQGVYYEICKADGFAKAFGDSFQNYVGEVIKMAITNAKIKVYPEEEYCVGKHRKNTVDWIFAEEDAALFIETKTKRLIQDAKVEVSSEKALKEELDKMADFVTQVYKTIKDYQENQYPSFKYQKQIAIFPLVVTLEDWLAFGPKVLGHINEGVKNRLSEEGLPSSWLEEMPYSICAVHELEKTVQIINIEGIKRVMEPKVFDKEKKEWSLGPYAVGEFAEAAKSVKFLFPEDFDRIFPEGIRNKLHSQDVL
jgi:hypothetical protein